MTLSRRDFLGAGAAAAAGLTLARPLDAATPAIDRISGTGTASRPVVIASRNGLRGVARAYEMIASGRDPGPDTFAATRIG